MQVGHVSFRLAQTHVPTAELLVLTDCRRAKAAEFDTVTGVAVSRGLRKRLG